jgi:phosphoribosylformylglycinamidine synthase
MDDVSLAVTPDAKQVGDLVYVLGVTRPELGGGEYFNMLGFTGNNVPKVDAAVAKAFYAKVAAATDKKLVNSLITPALGGLGVAFAKSAIGGRLGMEIELAAIPNDGCRNAVELLFSESNSRFVATVSPANKAAFEAALAGSVFACVGRITSDGTLTFRGEGGGSVAVEALVKSYKSTLAGI